MASSRTHVFNAKSKAQPSLGKKNFSILYWNIHGQKSKTVGDKFTDTDFFNICGEHDILGLVELHTDSLVTINGFKRIKQKIRRKTHKGPKISGGLAIFVRNDFSHMVKPVPNAHDDSIWVKINKKFTKIKIYLSVPYT